MMRVLKKIAVGVVSLGLLVVVIAWMAGAFHTKIKPGTAEAAVRKVAAGQPVGEIHQVTEHVEESVIGTVVAERKTSVSSKIMASIKAVHVSAGASVKQGDVLVELDARDLESRAQQAADAVTAAQAVLARAESDYKRRADLLAKKVISDSEFEQAEAQQRIARAELAKAKQAKQETDVAKTDAVIRAPITGKVVDRLAEPGDTASPGRPILTLYDPAALRLEAPVREGLATQIKIGDALRVRIDALGVELKGRVDEIVPQAETSSRSLLVKVGIPHQAGIYSGMFGRLFIPSGERQRICIPEKAIRRIGQLEYVDVVNSDGVVERRFVQTGEHGEFGNVELLSGANPGEKVILE